MKSLIFSAFLLIAASTVAQTAEELSIFDGRHWGVVLQHPETKNVNVKKNITYLSDGKGTLRFDLYLPPGIKSTEKRPAIIFLNGIGERPNDMAVKDWGIYASWPKLMAAEGYIGISMESDGTRIQESLAGLFNYLKTSGSQHQVDAERLGVYAASANVGQSAAYLMSNNAYRGIKAAALYYGNTPQGPYRKDLPVLFIISEGDVRGNNYAGVWTEVMKNNAPWTVSMGTNLIHAFDAFNDSDESRRMIKQTISFWKNYLDPIPPQSWEGAVGRKVLEAQYGRKDEAALALLTDYLKTNPTEMEAVFQHSGILKNMKRYDEALAGYKKIVAKDPDHAQALVNLYLIEHTLGHDTEARQYFTRAEKTGKISRDQYYGMGMTLYTNNDHKEGVKFFEKIVTMNPYATDYYNLACGYAMLNDKDKAFTALNKSIDMGMTSKAQFENDTDLTSLRGDQRYKELLARLK
jgi:tetratricopeptide (TPR) repeat protein